MAPVITGGPAAVAAWAAAAGNRATTVADAATHANNLRDKREAIKTRTLPYAATPTEAAHHSRGARGLVSRALPLDQEARRARRGGTAAGAAALGGPTSKKVVTTHLTRSPCLKAMESM